MEKALLNEVKAILKSLVLSCPEKITIEQLNRDYRDVEGQFIPFRKLGYGNLEQFLRSIPDTLMVFGSGPSAMVCFVANEKSNHIHDMIMRQRKPKAKRTMSMSARSRSTSSTKHAQRGNKFVSQAQQNRNKSGQQLSPFQTVNRSHLTRTPQLNELHRSQTKQLYVPMHFAFPQPNGIILNPIQCINYNTMLQNQAQINESHIRQVSSLLKQQCLISTPPQPPPPLPRHEERAVRFLAQNNSASHNKVVETKKEAPKATSNESTKKSLENSLVVTKSECEETKTQAPIKLAEDIESVVSMPKLFKPILESNLNENKNKGLQKEEIPSSLLKEDSLTKADHPKRFFDDSTDKAEDPDEAVPSFAAKNNVFLFDFPKHTVSYGRKISQYKLDDHITVGSRIQIFVTEIHNPFKFWFHIEKENNDIDLLMYQIERYYSVLGADDLRIPIACLTPGQICAASYNGLWHRAEIVAPPVNTTIKVSFMDYGTVSEVEVKNIKFLASYFAQLPAQALRGCLSHIKPRPFHWSHESSKYFLTLAEDQMLYAKIIEIDVENNILYMIVCNTNGEEVIQINTSLIEKGYACYNEEWKAERIKKNNGKRIHHPREDFPTFSMIESGEYPSFNELVNLQERGIDYETIYDLVIYNQSSILNKHENVPESIRSLPYFLTTSNPFRFDILLELYATTAKTI